MDKPLISVVVTAYNEQEYIGRCLRSLLDQNFPRDLYEIVVVNDASTDLTGYALGLFGSAIKVIVNEENLSLPASINKGIEHATGDYIIRVDADDFVNANFLHVLHLYLTTNPEYDAVACDYLLVDDEEIVLERCDCILQPIGCGILFKKEHLLEKIIR